MSERSNVIVLSGGKKVKVNPDGTIARGGRVKRRQEMERLRADNEDLRRRLGITQKHTQDTWGEFAPQEIRDQMAARAYIQENGHAVNALKRLGFNIGGKDGMSEESAKAIAHDIFGTEGFYAILARDLSDIEARQKEILARQVQIATHGDDDASVRATAILAKIAGWQKTPDAIIDNRKISLYTLVGNNARDAQKDVAELPPGSVDIADFLSHEPGEPVRIESDQPDAPESAQGYDDR